jgi:hypothetical protein
MKKQQRRHVRLKVSMPLEVTHAQLGAAELLITDLSDSGVFVKATAEQCPPVGDEVILKVTATLGGEEPSAIPARVVRITEEGMALEYL